jgi:hypothetical protein
MTAVSYLRVSGLGQVHGDGFARQREAVQERARDLGLEIGQEFRDEGVSGTAPLQDRPAVEPEALFAQASAVLSEPQLAAFKQHEIRRRQLTAKPTR